jgi:hypothetical protein
MIQIRLEYDEQVFTQIANDIESFQVIAFALLGQSLNKVKPLALADLRRTPRRRYWESSDFANDASRRAFFAKTGGKAYTRTGRYAAGWNMTLRKTDSGGEIVINNKEPSAKFVGGTFARSGRDFQQRGHIRTGWPKSQTTADKWLKAAQDDFEVRVGKYIDDRWGKVSTGTRNQ